MPTPTNPPPLCFHLMHPGGPSAPGDPNAAFCLDGVYHLHYIFRHPFRGKTSFSFAHVCSPDMVHWTWRETRLQPAFTGHGMFSGTGFLTKEGRPAVIYHGQGSGRNYIAIAKNNRLSDWEKPYAVEALASDGEKADIAYWDPDCFLIGDTYYAISGGQNPPLMKSKDLRNWTYAGPFLKRDAPDAALGEDISCGNFFPLGDKWMLLCISHPFGCRYYLGRWDAEAEQFEPETHGRMNWRREGQSVTDPAYRDFFAPESVLTPDGRRVMWAWLATLDPAIDEKTIQSLPRELSLSKDGELRIRPLRELETLRHDEQIIRNAEIHPPQQKCGGATRAFLAPLRGPAMEIRIRVERRQAERKRFGFELFADENQSGLLILIQPETATLRMGSTEAPFSVADLPEGEDVDLRIFIDHYLVEVFVNDRQAAAAACMNYREADGLWGYAFGAPIEIKEIQTWRLRCANEGYFEAQENRIWEPRTT